MGGKELQGGNNGMEGSVPGAETFEERLPKRRSKGGKASSDHNEAFGFHVDHRDGIFSYYRGREDNLPTLLGPREGGCGGGSKVCGSRTEIKNSG